MNKVIDWIYFLGSGTEGKEQGGWTMDTSANHLQAHTVQAEEACSGPDRLYKTTEDLQNTTTQSRLMFSFQRIANIRVSLWQNELQYLCATVPCGVGDGECTGLSFYPPSSLPQPPDCPTILSIKIVQLCFAVRV